ncbi:MAG TPA: response regulator [Pirellulales bacterium]|jgi:DNA-binding response OmpR family regulator
MMLTETCPGALLRPAIRPFDPTKILVVDDDVEVVNALRRRLIQQGFEVLTAKNGAQGRSLARRHRPDLILLDLRLPDVDGLKLCQELTDSPTTCGIPVILISGCDHADVIQQSREAGCEYFLRKPYDPNVLLRLVRHALKASRSWPHAERGRMTAYSRP